MTFSVEKVYEVGGYGEERYGDLWPVADQLFAGWAPYIGNQATTSPDWRFTPTGFSWKHIHDFALEKVYAMDVSAPHWYETLHLPCGGSSPGDLMHAQYYAACEQGAPFHVTFAVA